MNKQILITGSSRGIGREIALQAAKAGYDVVLHCNNNVEFANEVKTKIEREGNKARILQFDIKNRENVKEIITDDIEKNGAYFGIILNAGISKDNIFPSMEDNEWDDVINTNLTGLYNVLKPAIMPLIQSRQKGRIIALTSISGLSGNRGQVNYSASKAGITGAIKSLSLELAKRGITANCIAPGIIETDMTKDLPEDELKKMIPMKRFGKPSEIASLALYLLSEGASYITGQVISVNGGLY